MTLGTDADVEDRFEVLEVLVVGAEERFDAFLGNGNPLGSACLSQFISLLHNYLDAYYNALICLAVSAGLATVWRRRSLLSRLKDLNVQLPKLPLGHGRGRVHEQILGVLRHRKGDHFA